MNSSGRQLLRRAPLRVVALSVGIAVIVLGGFQAVPWAAAVTSSGDRAIFEPLPPVRILDTRPSSPVGPGESRVLQVTGAGGVAADATAVVLNVTAVSPTAGGWLTLYPADGALPLASNVNFSAGQVVPNAATVSVGTVGADAGKIRIFNSAGQTHVLVDVAGYYRGHTHDDRYYSKVQTQARLAANSLTCPAGQYLSTVAADGTPTCGAPPVVPSITALNGPVTSIPASGVLVFAGPRATIVKTASQKVVATISAVIGSSADNAVWYSICSGPPGGAATANPSFLVLNMKAGVQEAITSNAFVDLPAGTYDIGLCVRPVIVPLASSDFVHGTVTVHG